MLPSAEQRLDALDVQGRLLVDAAQAAGLEAAVPSCPGWTVATLLRHVGLVHRWAAEVVEAAGPEIDQDAFDAAAEPPGDDDLVEWARDAHTLLVRALRAAPDFDGWTFWVTPDSAREFWIRRQLQETAVHRMDAELAAGRPLTPMAPELAADSLDELILGLAPFAPLYSDEPWSLAVVPDDVDLSWQVSVAARPLVTGQGAGPADLTLRGPVNEINALLHNRAEGDNVRLEGDSRAAEEMAGPGADQPLRARSALCASVRGVVGCGMLSALQARGQGDRDGIKWRRPCGPPSRRPLDE